MNLKQCDNFNYSADQYAVQYLYEKETTIQNQLKQAQDAFYCKKIRNSFPGRQLSAAEIRVPDFVS